MIDFTHLNPQPVPQNADGTPHMAFYDAKFLLSFIWDGTSDNIQISHQGYGEPVFHTIPAPERATLTSFYTAVQVWIVSCIEELIEATAKV